MIVEPALLAVGDRRFLAVERDAHLRPRVPRPVPAGQRVGAERLLPLELEDPLARIGLSRLGGLALLLGDAGNGHAGQVAKCALQIKAAAMFGQQMTSLKTLAWS